MKHIYFYKEQCPVLDKYQRPKRFGNLSKTFLDPYLKINESIGVFFEKNLKTHGTRVSLILNPNTPNTISLDELELEINFYIFNIYKLIPTSISYIF